MSIPISQFISPPPPHLSNKEDWFLVGKEIRVFKVLHEVFFHNMSPSYFYLEQADKLLTLIPEAISVSRLRCCPSIHLGQSQRWPGSSSLVVKSSSWQSTGRFLTLLLHTQLASQ